MGKLFLERRLWAEFNSQKVGEDGLLRHKLYQLGDDWVHPNFGPFKITEEMHAEIVSNFEPSNLNYNHQPSDISAGKIVNIEDSLDADGWAYGTSRLTPRAIEYVNSGEYRGFSAEIDFKSADRKGQPLGCQLIGGALTNIPFFNIEFDSRRSNVLAASDEPARHIAAQLESSNMSIRFDAESFALFLVGPQDALVEGQEVALEIPPELQAIFDQCQKPAEEAEPETPVAASETVTVAASAEVASLQLSISNLKSTFESKVIELSTQLKGEREMRLRAEAENFLTLKRVKPSLRNRCVGLFLSSGQAEVESFLSEIGSSAFVPEGEIGAAGKEEISPIAFIESERAKLLASNPKLSTFQADVQLSNLFPEQFAAYDRGGIR